jgi:hypothetical protein
MCPRRITYYRQIFSGIEELEVIPPVNYATDFVPMLYAWLKSIIFSLKIWSHPIDNTDIYILINLNFLFCCIQWIRTRTSNNDDDVIDGEEVIVIAYDDDKFFIKVDRLFRYCSRPRFDSTDSTDNLSAAQ